MKLLIRLVTPMMVKAVRKMETCSLSVTIAITARIATPAVAPRAASAKNAELRGKLIASQSSVARNDTGRMSNCHTSNMLTSRQLTPHTARKALGDAATCPTTNNPTVVPTNTRKSENSSNSLRFSAIAQ